MSEQVITPTKLKIPPYAKIKVYWDDSPENYSKENKVLVRNHFANKYGVDKANINVVYRPVKIDKAGNTIEISGAGIENIMDTGYQRELSKEWLTRESKDVDYERLIKLDDKINAELNIDSTDVIHKHWSLSWMMINGFLCFGANNFVSLSNLKGLTIVNSLPGNQGGKTTFSIDSFKFLLYGKTTKTDKNEQIFNQYWDNDDLSVRGMVKLEDKEIWKYLNHLGYDVQEIHHGQNIYKKEFDLTDGQREIIANFYRSDFRRFFYDRNSEIIDGLYPHS